MYGDLPPWGRCYVLKVALQELRLCPVECDHAPAIRWETWVKNLVASSHKQEW